MPNNKPFDFKHGMNEYSEGTSECSPEYRGCIYRYNGRCCYHVATVKANTSRACYDPVYEYAGEEAL